MGLTYEEHMAREILQLSRAKEQENNDSKRFATKRILGSVILTRSTTTGHRTDIFNGKTTYLTDIVENRSADRLPPGSEILVGFHTPDKEHVHEDNTA